MAYSKCGKCNGMYFETVEKEPTNSAYKVIFVQCSSCGTPVGVTGYYNEGQLLKNQEQKTAELDSKLNQIQSYVQQIANAIRR